MPHCVKQLCAFDHVRHRKWTFRIRFLQRARLYYALTYTYTPGRYYAQYWVNTQSHGASCSMYGSSMHRRELLCNSRKCTLLLYEHVLQEEGEEKERLSCIWNFEASANTPRYMRVPMQSRIVVDKEGWIYERLREWK